jgi:hypothetical protein
MRSEIRIKFFTDSIRNQQPKLWAGVLCMIKTYTREVSVERKPEKISKFRAKINYCVVTWGPETNLVFENQIPKGVLLVKVLEILPRNGLYGLKIVLSFSGGTI